jgi:CBS domain containing-hemolysin-like protein
VQSINASCNVKEAYKKIQTHPFSRVLAVDPRGWPVGFILRTKLQTAFINNSNDSIEKLLKPLLMLPEDISLPNLFQKLLKRREHICGIVNKESEFLGIITLEDLIEHMLDLEIYDEQDHLAPNWNSP